MAPKKNSKNKLQEANKGGDDSKLRLAIVNTDRCRPKKCVQECKRQCPVVRMGKKCIEVEPTSKVAFISEELCVGCGICTKKCPFSAITIINLPKDMSKDTTHRYGPNTFKLHRLPIPRPGQVLGLVGTNGIGKSTALKILAGKQKPNLGNFKDPPDWEAILNYFRGSELQSYFTRIVEGKLVTAIKPQYVDNIPKSVKEDMRTVRDALAQYNNKAYVANVFDRLDLSHLMDRDIVALSGGELQRFAIGMIVCKNANVYMFDEPSSYLDVKQRLASARVIRSKLDASNYVIVVEHDLSVLDYLSDYICCLWGTPMVYGVVTMPFSVREGINIFLDGFVPTENLRFRPESLSFKVAIEREDEIKRAHDYVYPRLKKQLSTFNLTVEEGNFSDSQIVVMLGQNGTGKSTFIKMLAGDIIPDNEADLPPLHVSYKPQTVTPTFKGNVELLFNTKIRESFHNPQFVSDVIKPLNVDKMYDQEVQFLSGGELQRVSLVLALGKPADLYLLDEPSAYLDSEQRIMAARVIKRFILHEKKTAFVVEHDFIMATYMADKVIVYEGNPGIDCTARSPETLVAGMNRFLRTLEITFRRDPTNYRPRINQFESIKDREQKLSGNYFVMEE